MTDTKTENHVSLSTSPDLGGLRLALYWLLLIYCTVEAVVGEYLLLTWSNAVHSKGMTPSLWAHASLLLSSLLGGTWAWIGYRWAKERTIQIPRGIDMEERSQYRTGIRKGFSRFLWIALICLVASRLLIAACALGVQGLGLPVPKSRTTCTIPVRVERLTKDPSGKHRITVGLDLRDIGEDLWNSLDQIHIHEEGSFACLSYAPAPGGFFLVSRVEEYLSEKSPYPVGRVPSELHLEYELAGPLKQAWIEKPPTLVIVLQAYGKDRLGRDILNASVRAETLLDLSKASPTP